MITRIFHKMTRGTLWEISLPSREKGTHRLWDELIGSMQHRDIGNVWRSGSSVDHSSVSFSGIWSPDAPQMFSYGGGSGEGKLGTREMERDEGNVWLTLDPGRPSPRGPFSPWTPCGPWGPWGKVDKQTNKQTNKHRLVGVTWEQTIFTRNSGNWSRTMSLVEMTEAATRFASSPIWQ